MAPRLQEHDIAADNHFYPPAPTLLPESTRLSTPSAVTNHFNPDLAHPYANLALLLRGASLSPMRAAPATVT